MTSGSPMLARITTATATRARRVRNGRRERVSSSLMGDPSSWESGEQRYERLYNCVRSEEVELLPLLSQPHENGEKHHYLSSRARPEDDGIEHLDCGSTPVLLERGGAAFLRRRSAAKPARSRPFRPHLPAGPPSPRGVTAPPRKRGPSRPLGPPRCHAPQGEQVRGLSPPSLFGAPPPRLPRGAWSGRESVSLSRTTCGHGPLAVDDLSAIPPICGRGRTAARPLPSARLPAQLGGPCG